MVQDPITVVSVDPNTKASSQHPCTSQKAVVDLIRELYSSNKHQQVKIIFRNNSHLDNPDFLAKLFLYETKPHVTNFKAGYDDSCRQYTISFYLYASKLASLLLSRPSSESWSSLLDQLLSSTH